LFNIQVEAAIAAPNQSAGNHLLGLPEDTLTKAHVGKENRAAGGTKRNRSGRPTAAATATGRGPSAASASTGAVRYRSVMDIPEYVFCYTIVLPFFRVCGVSVSLLPMYYCLLALSGTTRRLTITPPPSINHQSATILTYLFPYRYLPAVRAEGKRVPKKSTSQAWLLNIQKNDWHPTQSSAIIGDVMDNKEVLRKLEVVEKKKQKSRKMKIVKTERELAKIKKALEKQQKKAKDEKEKEKEKKKKLKEKLKLEAKKVEEKEKEKPKKKKARKYKPKRYLKAD
jgi:hypothetical protein